VGSITKVFLVIGILLLSLIVWQVVFNEGGIIQRGWDAVAELINGAWRQITGGTEALVPLYADIFGAGARTDLQQVGP